MNNLVYLMLGNYVTKVLGPYYVNQVQPTRKSYSSKVCNS